MLPPSLRARLLVTFLPPVVALFAALGWAGYAFTRALLEEELGKGLAQIAAAAASQLSGERLLTVEAGDDERGTRTFKNLSRQLEEIRKASGARRVFAFDREGRMRVDAGGALPVMAEVPELARDRLELTRVLAGEPASSQVLFQGNDGRLYRTGYAPVWDSERRQVLGAVGVEGSGAFYGPLRSLVRGYAVLVGLGLLLLGVVTALAARGLAAPLQRLMHSALRIGQGDLTTPVPPEPTLEIGVLARELEEMRRGLEGRDRQLKMMLAGVAHEVRNPIGGIELFAGLLEEELPAAGGGDAKDHVQRIRREIDYLKRIVEDFLSFAREEKLATTALDGGGLVAAAADLVRADADAKGVALEVAAPPGAVQGDQSLLIAALVNLVRNAVQASPSGGRVQVRGVAEDGRYRVQVGDGGPGIPAEARERIFEPFFTTREKGTGLGLPLSRKIARAHGGEVRLLPPGTGPGAGAVFELELPRPQRPGGSSSPGSAGSP